MTALALIAVKVMFVACISLIVTVFFGSALAFIPGLMDGGKRVLTSLVLIILVIEGAVMCIAAVAAAGFAVWGLL